MPKNLKVEFLLLICFILRKCFVRLLELPERLKKEWSE